MTNQINSYEFIPKTHLSLMKMKRILKIGIIIYRIILRTIYVQTKQCFVCVEQIKPNICIHSNRNVGFYVLKYNREL